MNDNGYFVVSLDFELLWGVFDVVDFNHKRKYFENTRNVIPRILEEFSRFDIHATWAVVGMLFNKDWQEWNENKPKLVPNYSNVKLSAYKFGNSIKNDDSENLVFAPELIETIKNSLGQEIGTHTYSHYYCLESGQSSEEFKADLEKSIVLAGKLNIELKSLVFPRNQLKHEYLQICAEMGIENVRSNPSSWYWKDTLSEAFLVKIARSGDAYFPLGNKVYPFSQKNKEKGFPLEQKASRFLRPVEGNVLLRKLKINRIKKEMTKAAKNKQVYHLWWHPHNFGERPNESLEDLRIILEHFKYCQIKYNFRSVNMQEMNSLSAS